MLLRNILHESDLREMCQFASDAPATLSTGSAVGALCFRRSDVRYHIDTGSLLFRSQVFDDSYNHGI